MDGMEFTCSNRVFFDAVELSYYRYHKWSPINTTFTELHWLWLVAHGRLGKIGQPETAGLNVISSQEDLVPGMAKAGVCHMACRAVGGSYLYTESCMFHKPCLRIQLLSPPLLLMWCTPNIRKQCALAVNLVIPRDSNASLIVLLKTWWLTGSGAGASSTNVFNDEPAQSLI